MDTNRESIARLALKAREIYAEAYVLFDNAMEPRVSVPENNQILEDPEYQMGVILFDENLRALVSTIMAGLEAMGAGLAAREFRAALVPGMSENLMQVHLSPIDSSHFWSPLLTTCLLYLQVIEAFAGKDLLLPAVEAEVKMLERILKSTRKRYSICMARPQRKRRTYTISLASTWMSPFLGSNDTRRLTSL